MGGHRSVDNMNTVLNEGKIEYLSLSRPLIREPDLTDRWQSGECSPAKCVLQYVLPHTCPQMHFQTEGDKMTVP
ncbi:hypothetical protein [uncultured Ruminococcus sp.]|uniref:hypothetical protein n=1 Tax=uncultured Ruminococcus sp. TaxID=165186 RepID=UPI0025F7667C|nr:hypothetical protein [uncultured Ruminococcus sp.]